MAKRRGNSEAGGEFDGAILFAPLAIVFGVLGRSEARNTAKDGEGMGTAGMVLGIAAIVLTIPWAVFVATL